MILKRLPLKGVHNLRDLGGYPVGFDKATKWKTLFRADGLFGLDNEDINSVLNYCKMKTVLDLRGSKELCERPNDFAKISSVRYENVALIPENAENFEEVERAWQTLNNGYVAIAEHGKKEIKRAIDIIAETLPEPVLFHCTAGKDRTGIISSLILGICGADIFDIVTDYEVSSTYIRRDLVKITDPGKETNMEYVKSPPETILHFLNHITDNYGSIISFMMLCGIDLEQMDHIRRNFLVDITEK